MTEAASEHNEYPLHREVLALREENAQLRARVAALDKEDAERKERMQDRWS